MTRMWLALALVAAVCCRAAEPVTVVDFAAAGHGWRCNPRAKAVAQDGVFAVELTGEDPWIEGPAVDLPGVGEAQKLEIELDASTGEAGTFELFYAPEGKGFSAESSVFLQRDPGSAVYRGYIPAVGPRLRFRLDPPGDQGRVVFRALRVRPLVPLAAPAFERPQPVALPANALRCESGCMAVSHDPQRWNAFVCSVNGRPFAAGNPSETPAHVVGKTVVPVPLAAAGTTAERTPDGFAVKARTRDAGGAEWRLERRFAAAGGAVRVETSLTVSAPREVIHLPWLTLFAGAGGFGERKTQALLPGVEYLADEPSSNEKEIAGPAANRRLVEAYKVCYPMMALAADGRWLSLAWKAGALPVSPLFDSPDRIFGSGGHVLGLWSPPVGAQRFEGELVVYGGVKLEAGKTYSCEATLSGGAGAAVTEAVGDYVARTGLPPLPRWECGLEGAVRLLAAGWLDSAAREGTCWRHAVWGSHFPPQPAEDPPAYMLWLASQTQDAALKARLREAAQAVIASLPKGATGINGISHVKRPTGALLYGDLAAAVTQAQRRSAQLAAQLATGEAHYRPGKVDYASTLGNDACNGYTALAAEEMLSDAALTGDESAIAAALAVLDKMTARYAGQVPRGAQPWEMPLHTPDIVASARLVRGYVLGYLLSGNAAYLEQARYWAWTGVTMVYLAPPTDGPVGRYATIGVIGATNWRAPNWIGQPVQWCGLVYRSALEDLARVDAAQRATWQTLAHGITLTGLQMCFPVGDPKGRGGLLPDFFLLKPQVSDGPAVNPGTVGANVAEAFGRTPLVTATRLSNGSLVHAPGEVREERAEGGTLKLAVTAWPEDGYRLLVTRLGRAPARATWNGAPVAAQYLEDAHVAILPLKGSGTLELAP